MAEVSVTRRPLTQPKIRVLPDYESLSLAAAEKVSGRLRSKPEAVFLLPTGVTPLGMYRRLVEMHDRDGLSFAGAAFFNLDEYLDLDADHPASYHAYMRENFYGLVDADPRRVHVPDGSASDPEAECERYEAAMKEAGGVDLCVLGIGRNGHVGFNEPGAPFDSRTRVVRLAESTRRVNAGDFEGGRAPERAITVGMRTIFESREIMLLASGANKAQAVAAAMEGKISEAVPASMLRRRPEATFLLDREASSAIGEAG
ncbi:MAG: glucosamine-6-phosphate deaminase [Rubrobacteraceae bacterium]